MDKDTVARLETVRRRIPRYLFRAWNDTTSPSGLSRLSGGHQGLNTPEAVTPLAFSNGGGHSSVYDMKEQSFLDMAYTHLTGQSVPETELSSWAGSLSFALNNVAASQLGGHYADEALDGAHIAIIDTKELWDDVRVPVFYVPELDFLQPGGMNYPHEYLAHGIIKGSAYKAMPLRIFNEVITLAARKYKSFRVDDGQECHEIVRESIDKARKIGDQYGDKFALPMLLAVLCRKKRDSKLFQEGIEEKQFNRLMDRISDLTIPGEWQDDSPVDREYEIKNGFGDVEQMCRLIYALSTGFTKSTGEDEYSDEEEEPSEEQLIDGDEIAAESKNPDEEPQTVEHASPTDPYKPEDEASAKYATAAQARAAARVSARRREERMTAAELGGASDTNKVRQAKEKAKRLLRPAK